MTKFIFILSLSQILVSCSSYKPRPHCYMFEEETQEEVLRQMGPSVDRIR